MSRRRGRNATVPDTHRQCIIQLQDIAVFVSGSTKLKKLNHLERMSIKVRHQLLDNALERMEKHFGKEYRLYDDMMQYAHELSDELPQPFTSLERRARQNRNRKFFHHPQKLRRGRRRVRGRAFA